MRSRWQEVRVGPWGSGGDVGGWGVEVGAAIHQRCSRCHHENVFTL